MFTKKIVAEARMHTYEHLPNAHALSNCVAEVILAHTHFCHEPKHPAD